MSARFDPLGDIQRFVNGIMNGQKTIAPRTLSTKTNQRNGQKGFTALNGWSPNPIGPPNLTASYPRIETGKILPWASGPYGTGAKKVMASGPGERVF